MHKKTRQAYDEAGFQKDETPQEAIKKVFEHRTKRSEAKNIINQVWRVSRGKGKEFILYDLTTIKNDLAGNEERLNELVGRWQNPKFRKQFDPTSGDVIATQQTGFDEVYEIPFSKAKMKEILESGDSENTKFTLNTGSNKFGGFSADDFVNRSYEELVQIANGVTPAAPVEVVRPELDFKTPKDVEKEAKELRKQEEEEQKTIREARERQIERTDEERKRLLAERQRLLDEAIGKRKSDEDKGSDKATATVTTEDNKGAFVEKTKIKEDVNFVLTHEDGTQTRSDGKQPAITTTKPAESTNNNETEDEALDKEVEESQERRRGRKPRSSQEEE